MADPRKDFVKKIAVTTVVVVILRLIIAELGWHRPSIEPKMLPVVALWIIFGLYWAIAGLDSAPTQSSESQASTYLHQSLLLLALVLTIFPVPWLTGSFLPGKFHFFAPLGLAIQAAFLLLAVWARRHLGRNWSAEVRIAVEHQLIRTGPYRFLRHPIYTGMLGMVLGSAIVLGQYHSLLGLAILAIAYMRKTRLEEEILRWEFGPDYDTYRRDTWALVPLLY